MSINNTISNLGLELNKLFQKVERLKIENEALLRKIQELEEQLKSTSSEQGDTGDKLVKYLNQLKNINQEGSTISLETELTADIEKKTEYKRENVLEINSDNDFI